MRELRLFVLICFLLMVSGQAAFSAEPEMTDARLGEMLVRLFWADVKAKNWDAVASTFADGFQSVRVNGATDRVRELALYKKISIGNYKLTGFKVTRQGPVLTVSYRASVEEVFGGKKHTAKDVVRQCVWLNVGGKWKMIARAVLLPAR